MIMIIQLSVLRVNGAADSGDWCLALGLTPWLAGSHAGLDCPLSHVCCFPTIT
ncbi:hypothetical protein J4Q44_G00050150 [Coregonus suidteri]|uniref:Uncharacterized protein n=1 Tax=Coregonus suidteri TaxID=861788 RepID=A0AAN8MF97_9TELE